MTLFEKLEELYACKEGLEWAKGRTFEQAWRDCDEGEWMLWFLQKTELCDVRTLTLIKGKCAELALPFMWDERSREAVYMAVAFGNGNADEKMLNQAAQKALEAGFEAHFLSASAADISPAAYAAAKANAFASHAAYAAASTTYSAVDVLYVEDAYTASGNDYRKHKYKSIQKRFADICREVLPKPNFETLKNELY